MVLISAPTKVSSVGPGTKGERVYIAVTTKYGNAQVFLEKIVLSLGLPSNQTAG
jgi:hypothetical protein